MATDGAPVRPITHRRGLSAAAPAEARSAGTDRDTEGSAPAGVRGTANAEQARFALLTLGLSAPLVGGLWAVLAPLEALDILLVTLFALNALWVASAAATTLLGLRESPEADPPDGWHATQRTAVLFLICGEAPEAVAGRIAAMQADLARAGDAATTDLWLLSDTPAGAAGREARAVADLLAARTLRYRRRALNLGRKPGNIADWVAEHGGHYDTMLVMDADSAMSASRLATLRWRMENAPGLGLLQSGIRLRPGTSRLARLQRLSARLTGPVFIHGLAAWSGSAGNYWGHNALLRVVAFREVARLPALRGPAPFGGDILSHDFVEAAWLRRAGWAVAVSPESRGSHESGPADLRSFHKRDRRWCQGNLQHLRLLFDRGLDPASRVHLASGVQSYLASPIWLVLVLLFLLSGMAPGAVPVLSGALALLLVPKLSALARVWRRTGKPRQRRLFLRATATELALSTLLSPLVMVRQTLAVAAVALGRDCGWKADRPRRAPRLPGGAVEAAAGGTLVAIALLAGESVWQALWLVPIAGPLLAAPWLVRWLDSQAPA